MLLESCHGGMQITIGRANNISYHTLLIGCIGSRVDTKPPPIHYRTGHGGSRTDPRPPPIQDRIGLMVAVLTRDRRQYTIVLALW